MENNNEFGVSKNHRLRMFPSYNNISNSNPNTNPNCEIWDMIRAQWSLSLFIYIYKRWEYSYDFSDLLSIVSFV